MISRARYGDKIGDKIGNEVLQHKGLVYKQILILKPFTPEGFPIDD